MRITSTCICGSDLHLYEPRLSDTSKLAGIEPADWAEKIVSAIEDNDEVLNPTAAERLAKLAILGIAIQSRTG